MDKVKKALRDFKVKKQKRDLPKSLFEDTSSGFHPKKLEGSWVTCYEFESKSKSGTETLLHADIAQLKAVSDRRVTARNTKSSSRTEKHRQPFLNEIQAELVNRHLVGCWKNVNDTFYFGGIHLAVLPGENMMKGYYTSLSGAVTLTYGSWTWVRIDHTTIRDKLLKVVLFKPRKIKGILDGHGESDGPLNLKAVVEPS